MSLRSFLEKMEARNEVTHITDAVSPKFEISAIMKALSDCPVLIFENVEGYQTKVVGNVCGARSRTCSALETTPSRLLQ